MSFSAGRHSATAAHRERCCRLQTAVLSSQVVGFQGQRHVELGGRGRHQTLKRSPVVACSAQGQAATKGAVWGGGAGRAGGLAEATSSSPLSERPFAAVAVC